MWPQYFRLGCYEKFSLPRLCLAWRCSVKSLSSILELWAIIHLLHFFLHKLSTRALKRSVILMPTAFTLGQISTNAPAEKVTQGMVKSACPQTLVRQHMEAALHNPASASLMVQERSVQLPKRKYCFLSKKKPWGYRNSSQGNQTQFLTLL